MRMIRIEITRFELVLYTTDGLTVRTRQVAPVRLPLKTLENYFFQLWMGQTGKVSIPKKQAIIFSG